MVEAEAVRVAMLPDAARISLREATALAGVVPGTAINRAVQTQAGAALMLGPDEWLLILPPGTVPDLPACAVDVSHRSLGIAVAGPFAAVALNAFVALDLDPAAFPVDMCTRTVLGKAEIVLWRTAPETFWIDVARSFVPYVLACLDEARREFS